MASAAPTCDEVLLQPMSDARAPRLRCSNCHFERSYTFWYKRIDFKDRQINFCPGCGYKILGVEWQTGE